MMDVQRIKVQAYHAAKRQFVPRELVVKEGQVLDLLPAAPDQAGDAAPPLYLSDGFIDSHAHVYDGATDLGIPADRIGYRTGVRLVVDAGSAGAINFPCLRDYVMPAQETPIKAFLNISRIGLVTKQPYHDRRVIDAAAAERCLREDGGEYLLGIRVLTSGLIVEGAGLEPLRKAVEAARRVGVPIMAHVAEGPPLNEEVLAFLDEGDIITHCFHGAPNRAALLKASRNHPLNPAYFSADNILWQPDGTPTACLEEALLRGVRLDVGHGAASLDQQVARAAIARGVRGFSISTDAHVRNVDTVVRDLPHIISKFLAFGLSLEEVVESVTVIPARQLGLVNWCGQLSRRATLFRVRKVQPDDPPLVDSYGAVIEGTKRIEPVGIIRGGRLIIFENAEG
jgi:dihydroorotase